MRTAIQMFLIFLFLICGNALAQNDISGTWEGTLEIAPEQKMTIRFVITKDDKGYYKAVLSSLDAGPIRDEPASAVKYTGDSLTIEVDSLSGSFSGAVGKDTITGEWKQPGSTFPLLLKPHKKSVLSPKDEKRLLGEWSGKLKVNDAISLTIILRFEKSGDGTFAAYMDSPDENLKGLKLADVTLDGKDFSLRVLVNNARYTAVFENNTLSGPYVIPGRPPYELHVTKGKYIEPGIDMPAEDIKKPQ